MTKKFLAFLIPALAFVFMLGALMIVLQQRYPQSGPETGNTWITPKNGDLGQRNAARFTPETRDFDVPASPTNFGSTEHKGFVKAPTGG